jgi:hypothetical protein
VFNKQAKLKQENKKLKQENEGLKGNLQAAISNIHTMADKMTEARLSLTLQIAVLNEYEKQLGSETRDNVLSEAVSVLTNRVVELAEKAQKEGLKDLEHGEFINKSECLISYYSENKWIQDILIKINQAVISQEWDGLNNSLKALTEVL